MSSNTPPILPLQPPNPFLFQLSRQHATQFTGGTLQGADERTFHILAGQDAAIYLVTLQGGAVREPHWHPKAWEANYVISGSANWSVLSTHSHPGNTYLHEEFNVSAGDLVFIPQGYFHYFANASDVEPLVVLIAFNSSIAEPGDDIGIVASVSSMPDVILDTVFAVPKGTFASIPKNMTPVVIAMREFNVAPPSSPPS